MKKTTNGVVGRKAQDFADRLQIVLHPAFRLGFLDAMNNKPHDHDDILARIDMETPRKATDGMFFDSVQWAQVRYEEGRLVQRTFKLKCRAWTDPRYPPASVIRFCKKGTEDGSI